MEAREALEIVLPEAKPALEWILGRVVQKVSPRRRHALLQLAIGESLRAWARGRGEVGTEWRFRLSPPGEERRPLVPDVAYLSFERSRDLSDEILEAPPIAPDIAVEILSPDDRRANVEEKRRVYLAAGVRLLIHVDPETRRVEYDGHPEEFPDLQLPFEALFAELDRKG